MTDASKQEFRIIGPGTSIGFDRDFWRHRRVFLTGHTGFKGSWLALWLSRLGARVSGLSLPPRTNPSLFALGAQGRCADFYGDVTDQAIVVRALAECDPEVIIHLAAQALVRPSYIDPVGTFATNVMGTVNVLQAVRSLPSVRVLLVVTSDKVYENHGRGRPFVEDDRLGGHDPYSSSKACAELVVASFRNSLCGSSRGLATARAGNVIGGGDWSPFRIVRDLVDAHESGRTLALRYPNAIRPWQHVLDPLAGYLLFAQTMARNPNAMPPTLNFGPGAESFRTVSSLVEAFSTKWGGRPSWHQDTGNHPPEAMHLTLDASQAGSVLGWRPLLSFEEAVNWTADWYRAFWSGEDITAVTFGQIEEYMTRLR